MTTGPTAGPALTWMAWQAKRRPANRRVAVLPGPQSGDRSFARPRAHHRTAGASYHRAGRPSERHIAGGASGPGTTAEAPRIRTQRVTEMSTPRTVNEPGQRVGGGVTPPRLVTKREPEYAPEARALKIEGKVVLQVTVDVDGSARDIQLKQGLGFGLDEAAATAVSQWRFAPGARGGEPVPVLATIEVNFRLL